MSRARPNSGALLGLTLAWACTAALAEDPAGQAQATVPAATTPAQKKTLPSPTPSQKTSLALTPAQKTSPAPTPAQWLERMNHALTTRNYDGTFSHWHGGHVEMLRIIHRVQDGNVSERLVSLDGSGREFIRSGANLACYLPDRRTVLVEQRPPQESLVGFPAVDDQTASFYDIREVGRMRLNRRDTHVITVSPRDEYRYGYRLWIDASTAMPLKTQLCDAHGRIIEQVVFASLTLPVRIADASFRPEVSTLGFRWLRTGTAAPLAPAAPATSAWNALRLPPGFRMSVRSAQVLPGSNQPVDHLVFTDGVASVSVFVETQTAAAAQAPSAQSAAVGSSSAFSTVVDGHKITAVGEVPLATVQFIATQVKAQDLVPAGVPQR
ncbi:MAG TPA: MucB/RseB C-terminal domain-containing protein [Steroidobacteraceae bacterium]|jgi:sigma-E factor negative regulatory protein RseB|nr:MucB/RseB C-terminal domain-containing protein [Steroidobacteraceae bacterium]